MSDPIAVGNFEKNKEAKGYDLRIRFKHDFGYVDDYSPFEKGVIDYVVHFFEIVSFILYRATHKQRYISNIIISAGSDPGDFDIDIDVMPNRFNTSVGTSRIWRKPKDAMTYSMNHLYSPGAMLHELGHYLFGLGDEFAGCISNPDSRACIMEYFWGNVTRYRKKDGTEYGPRTPFNVFWDDYTNGSVEFVNEGVVTDFCQYGEDTGIQHIPNPDTDHYKMHGKKSCWEVIEKRIQDEKPVV